MTQMFFHINKNKSDEFLPLLAFQKDVVNDIFLKYSKEGRSSTSHLGLYMCVSGVKKC